MAAPTGTVRFCQDGPTLILQIAGWATMKQSLPLRRFVEQSLAGQTRNVWVDLRHCTYVDSTFLGTLLFLQRVMGRKGCGEYRLVSPAPPCSELFKQMGVEDVFHIAILEEPAPSFWTVLSSETEDKQGFTRNVIQAHEELAGLPGDAGEPFRAVARCLAKDVEKKT